ncbi:MAG: hypothetical protein ACLQEQ_09110 [Nitrososphaerales archaeon]
MNAGLWVWPSDTKAQQKVLRTVAGSPQILHAMSFLAKSKEGLSNSELDDLTADNSNWMTLWTVRQLMSLGFVEYKIDFFGGPARYQLTELGRNGLGTVTGQPAQQKPPAQAPPAPQVAAPVAKS